MAAKKVQPALGRDRGYHAKRSKENEKGCSGGFFCDEEDEIRRFGGV